MLVLHSAHRIRLLERTILSQISPADPTPSNGTRFPPGAGPPAFIHIIPNIYPPGIYLHGIQVLLERYADFLSRSNRLMPRTSSICISVFSVKLWLPERYFVTFDGFTFKYSANSWRLIPR